MIFKEKDMIFFDLDDTLLDHKGSEYESVKEFYKEYKDDIKIKEESFYELWYQISKKFFNKYLKGEITFEQQRINRIKEVFEISNSIKLSDKEANLRFHFYLQKYEDSWKPFGDVISCLQKLTDYKLGIISNGDFNQQYFKLVKLGINNLFTCIITASEYGIAKPNIKLFEKACNKVKLLPENCYYIGDDLETDILPSNKIGMHGIWLNRELEPLELPNIVTINSLNELRYAL